jgi:predicted aspartyl protease
MGFIEEDIRIVGIKKTYEDKCIVDTGSNFPIAIREDLINEIGSEDTGKIATVTLSDGSKRIFSVHRIPETIVRGCNFKPVEAVILPNESKFPCVIGVDLLQKTEAKLKFGSDKIESIVCPIKVIELKAPEEGVM